VAPRRATIRGKKIWGGIRHLLVDTQGNLLEVSVTGAHHSEELGAKSMLERVRAIFPTIKLLWGDRNSGGQLITWLQLHLGWTMQIVRRGIGSPTWPTGARRHRGRVGCPLPARVSAAAKADGWSNVASPGSSGGVASVATMRDYHKAAFAFIKLSACRRMLSLLAPGFP
jgi:hypothetical protein